MYGSCESRHTIWSCYIYIVRSLYSDDACQIYSSSNLGPPCLQHKYILGLSPIIHSYYRLQLHHGIDTIHQYYITPNIHTLSNSPSPHKNRACCHTIFPRNGDPLIQSSYNKYMLWFGYLSLCTTVTVDHWTLENASFLSEA